MRIALVLLVAAGLAGCGGDGGPRLEHADTERLLTLVHRIPHESACAQAKDIDALHARVTALLDAGRVPTELEESLSTGARDLVARTPTCLPAVEATTRPGEGDHGKGHGHGHGKEKKHGRGEGD